MYAKERVCAQVNSSFIQINKHVNTRDVIRIVLRSLYYMLKFLLFVFFSSMH